MGRGRPGCLYVLIGYFTIKKRRANVDLNLCSLLFYAGYDADADNAAYATMTVLGVELKRNEQGAVSMFLFLAWDYLIILNKIK